MTVIYILSTALLGITFSALHIARQRTRERDEWKEKHIALRKETWKNEREFALNAAALEEENRMLREQLRQKGVLMESAFASAKRFHRVRFEKGIESLRRISGA